nr:immunoglobulin heavy chain junction region [Mus musculus]MBK4197791.1 immunoglobulin heavy chain junction region [Mus musculus]
CARGGGLQDYW